MNESTRLTTPNLLYFPYPGFPSIVVGYLQGSDFFFSGHCGFPIINMMEYIWMKKYWFAAYCAFVDLVEIFLDEGIKIYFCPENNEQIYLLYEQ